MVDAVPVLIAHDLRRRWRSWVALVLLVGLAGGLATASFAGWRRTLGAMDRFVAAARPADGYVSGGFDQAAVEALPEVEATSGGAYLLMVPVDEDGSAQADRLGAINPFSVDDDRFGRDYERPIVVEGRLADPGEALDATLWGWTWDVVAGDGNDPGLIDRELDGVLADPDIADVGALYGLEATELRNGARSVTTTAIAIDVRRGAVAPRLLQGRPPRDEGEVALGAATAAALDVRVGDQLEVAVGGRPVPFTVSGLAVFNPGLDADRIGEGSLFDPSAAERLGDGSGPGRLVIGYAPGADGDEVFTRLQARFGQTVLNAVPPVDVDQLDRVSGLPVAFSLLVAATALVTLAFTLALTVRRGRRDLAVLRTLGFDRSQLRSAVAVQATVLVLPAAVLGAVLGLAVGRVAWTGVAEGLGAPVVAIAPLGSVVLVVVATVALGNAIAAVPGRVAATTDPAAILRAE